jgi:hypothetical protein
MGGGQVHKYVKREVNVYVWRISPQTHVYMLIYSKMRSICVYIGNKSASACIHVDIYKVYAWGISLHAHDKSVHCTDGNG